MQKAEVEINESGAVRVSEFRGRGVSGSTGRESCSANPTEESAGVTATKKGTREGDVQQQICIERQLCTSVIYWGVVI